MRRRYMTIHKRDYQRFEAEVEKAMMLKLYCDLTSDDREAYLPAIQDLVKMYTTIRDNMPELEEDRIHIKRLHQALLVLPKEMKEAVLKAYEEQE